MQLADSALPVGSAAHSFGLEMLTADGVLAADSLPSFLRDYLQETGVLEAAFCRAGHRQAGVGWTALNQQLSARKPAQESRAASLTLGRRFLQLFLALDAARILAARRTMPRRSAMPATRWEFRKTWPRRATCNRR